MKDNFFYNMIYKLKEYFVLCVFNIISSLGLNLVGWEDGLLKEGGVFFEWIELFNFVVYGNVW